MRKALLIAIILAIVALLVAPGIVGIEAKTQYQSLISQLESSGLKSVKQNYQQGLLTSNATSEWEINIPQQPDGTPASKLNFTIHSNITHGPYSLEYGVMQAVAIIDTQLKPAQSSILPAGYGANIRTRMEFDGSSHNRFNLSAIKQSSVKDKPAVIFDGATGSIIFGPGYNKAIVDLAAPSLRIKDKGTFEVVISGMSLKSESTQGIVGLMLGGGAFAIDSITATPATDEPAVSMQKLQFSFDSSATEENAEIAASYKVDSLTANRESYGPIILDLRLSNLSTPALGAFQQAINKLNSQQLSPNQQGIAMFGLMMTHGAAFLKNDPKLAIEKLHVATPDGLIKGHLEIQTDELLWTELFNVNVLVNKLKIDINLQMPEQILHSIFKQQAHQMLTMQIQQQQLLGMDVSAPDDRQLDEQTTLMANQQLDNLLSQEFVVLDGSEVKAVASLRDGLFSINGKSLPLPMLTAP